MTTIEIGPKTTSAARDRLREAVRAATKADLKAEEAQQAAQRASGVVQRAGVALQSFANLDLKIHQHRVNAVRRGVDSGLPEELKAQQRERAAATEDLESALAVSKTLAAESAGALSYVECTQTAVKDAAAGLVLEEAMSVARELEEVCGRRHHLRMLLEAFTVPFGAVSLHTNAQEMIRSALADQARALPLDQSPRHNAARFWQDFANRLLANPEATIGELPTTKQLWGY